MQQQKIIIRLKRKIEYQIENLMHHIIWVEQGNCHRTGSNL